MPEPIPVDDVTRVSRIFPAPQLTQVTPTFSGILGGSSTKTFTTADIVKELNDKSFFERFFLDTDRRLGDPHSARKYTRTQKLRDLHEMDQTIFDDLLSVFGLESMMGYTEKEITITGGVSFYPLPINFRQFVQLEKRDSNGRVQDIIRSKSFYDSSRGVDILTADRGFRIFQPPSGSSDATWTLIYLRAPGFLHYAKASGVGDRSITSGKPGLSAGEVILVEDYYRGMEIRVFSAENGAAPQQREIIGFSLRSDKKGVFHVRHPWTPKPEGDVWYELCPTVPLKYDSIYSMDAAIATLPHRDRPLKSLSLVRERKRRWNACIQHFSSNVSDRGPTRMKPLTAMDLVPCEVPYGY